MSQTNFTPILLYASNTATSVPSAGNLTNSANGAEVAVNTADKRLFTKDSGGSVVELGTNPSSLSLPNQTANGVLYLNGSKVATSGSALTFDGTNLAVGVSSPGAPIGVQANASALGLRVIGRSTGDLGYINFRNNANSSDLVTLGGQPAGFSVDIAGTEGMRLTSTGLGIGTSSPTEKLTVSGGAAFSRIGFNANAINTVSTAQSFVRFNSTGADFYVGTESGTGGVFFPSSTAYAAVLFNANATPMQFYTSGALRATLDSSGNLGLGVTPSAWSGYKAFEMQSYAVSSDINSFYNTNNAFYNGSSWRYIGSKFATRYDQDAALGAHRWYTAPSGTAGNAISFTQAMTLSAAGGLSVGNTTDPGAYTLSVGPRDTSNNDGTIRIDGGSGVSGEAILVLARNGASDFLLTSNSNLNEVRGVTNVPLTFRTNDTERARITSGGQLVLNSGATGNQLQFWDTGAVAERARLGINASNDLDFAVGSTTPKATITSSGSFVAGAQAALATTATDGFLYVPTCAGTPTGVPTAITGMAPIVVNTTNNKLYFYSGGAWRDAGP